MIQEINEREDGVRRDGGRRWSSKAELLTLELPRRAAARVVTLEPGSRVAASGFRHELITPALFYSSTLLLFYSCILYSK
jgi:hypothetical protein